MKKISKSLLTLILAITLIASNFTPFVPMIKVYADEAEYVTVTLDVNGGKEISRNTFTGVKGKTLYDIFEPYIELEDFEFPTHEDYSLECIMKNESDEVVDFDTFIYDDTTLHCDWTAMEPTGSINLTIDRPEVGSEITEVEIDGEMYPSDEPSMTWDEDHHYGVDKYWFVYDEESDSYILFIGKFEAGKKYYAFVNIFTDNSDDNDHYFSDEVITNLKVNGEVYTDVDVDETHQNISLYYEIEPISHEPEEPENYTVTFVTNGGTNINPIEVEAGGHLTLPANPTKAHYTFVRWYKDELLTQAFDESEAINSDLELFAEWEEVEKHTVTFNTNGGSLIAEEEVYDGEKLEKPEDPTKENNEFGGWYTDADLENEYDFNNPVTTNLDLYAKWNVNETIPEKHTVTFVTNGGSTIEPIEVDHNTAVTKPADPTRDNYTFNGWYSDELLTQPYDFATIVETDITLYAMWTENVQPAEPEIEIVVEPNTIDFGTVESGFEENILKEVVVRNTSQENTYEISLDNPVANGPFGSMDFSGATLAPGESVNVTLIANHNHTNATVPGEYEGEYVFNYNIAGEELGDSVTVMASIKIEEAEEPEPEKFTVTFHTNGGSTVETQTVEDGEKVTRPTDPTKENNEFGGWYTDAELTNEYDFNTAVTANLDLYAKWTEEKQEEQEPEKFTILDGNNQTYDPASEKELSIRASGALADLQSVKLDGEIVDPENYELTEGSTIVTFKPAYLNTLSAGNHTVTFVYASGSVNAAFTIANPTTNTTDATNPSTYDNIMNWVGLLGVSAFGVALGSIVIRKSKKNN